MFCLPYSPFLSGAGKMVANTIFERLFLMGFAFSGPFKWFRHVIRPSQAVFESFQLQASDRGETSGNAASSSTQARSSGVAYSPNRVERQSRLYRRFEIPLRNTSRDSIATRRNNISLYYRISYSCNLRFACGPLTLAICVPLGSKGECK